MPSHKYISLGIGIGKQGKNTGFFQCDRKCLSWDWDSRVETEIFLCFKYNLILIVLFYKKTKYPKSLMYLGKMFYTGKQDKNTNS